MNGDKRAGQSQPIIQITKITVQLDSHNICSNINNKRRSDGHRVGAPENETSPRRDGKHAPASTQQKTIEYSNGRGRDNTEPPTHGSTDGARHSPERRAKRGRNPVTRSVVAEASRMRRVLRTPPKHNEPDGDLPPQRHSRSGGNPEGNAPNPGCSGENRNPEGSSAGEPVRSRFGRTVFYPANVFPHRRAEEATALVRGTNQAMTGAVLSHHASRRADGLATSAVLDQKRVRT